MRSRETNFHPLFLMERKKKNVLLMLAGHEKNTESNFAWLPREVTLKIAGTLFAIPSVPKLKSFGFIENDNHGDIFTLYRRKW